MRVLYSALADLVVLAHFVYLAVLIFGGLAAARWPRFLVVHLVAVGWALGAVTIRYNCPLTGLEQQLRESAGHGVYEGSFLRHYVRGVLFPEWMTPFVVGLIVGMILVGWIRISAKGVGHLRRGAASGSRGSHKRVRP